MSLDFQALRSGEASIGVYNIINRRFYPLALRLDTKTPFVTIDNVPKTAPTQGRSPDFIIKLINVSGRAS
jgi:hypothetical protein